MRLNGRLSEVVGGRVPRSLPPTGGCVRPGGRERGGLDASPGDCGCGSRPLLVWLLSWCEVRMWSCAGLREVRRAWVCREASAGVWGVFWLCRRPGAWACAGPMGAGLVRLGAALGWAPGVLKTNFGVGAAPA